MPASELSLRLSGLGGRAVRLASRDSKGFGARFRFAPNRNVSLITQ